MTPDSERIARLQIGLFVALSGLLKAKGLVTNDELITAVDTVRAHESDPLVSGVYGAIIATLEPVDEPGSVADPKAALRVIDGGREP